MDHLADAIEKRLREHALAELPSDAKTHASQFDLSKLLHVYGVWRGRFVPQSPRRVHWSKELQASRKAQEHRGDLDALVAKLESGDDLTPHLSKRVATAYVAPNEVRPGKEHLRKDRDGMLAEWGIHHVHLRPQHGPDLLFAFFRPDDAYLIGIYPHQWTLREVAEVIIRNWPTVGPLTELRGVVGLSQQLDDQDHRDLRNAGTTLMLEIDGRVWMPPGQATDRSPTAVTGRVNAIMWALRYLREGRYDEHLAEAERRHEAEHGRSPLRRWLPAIADDQCGVMWESMFVPLARLP